MLKQAACSEKKEMPTKKYAQKHAQKRKMPTKRAKSKIGACSKKEPAQKNENAQKISMLKRNKGNQLLRELTLTCSLSSPSSKFRSHSVKHFVGLHSPLLNLGCSLQLKMPLMSSMSTSPSPLLSILRKAS